MIIIDKNSEEYLQRREFYRRMFEKTIKEYEGLLNFDVDQLLDLGRMKINGLYVKDDLNFSNSVLDLGDLGKLIASTTIFRRTNEKEKNVVDPRAREKIADTMLDLIPDSGYYYSPLTISVLGRKYGKLHEKSSLVKQINESYGLTYSDEGINYGDTLLGLIAVNRLIALHQEFRTLSAENVEDKDKLKDLEELKTLVKIVACSRDIYGSGRKGLEGLLEEPLSEEENKTYNEELNKLFTHGGGADFNREKSVLPVIAIINSDAPMSEVFAEVRKYSDWCMTSDFREAAHIDKINSMIEDFDESLSIDDVYPRLAAAYYYLQVYETIAPKVLNVNNIDFEEKHIWASVWENYCKDQRVAAANKAILASIKGPYKHLNQLCEENGWFAKDQVFVAEASVPEEGDERPPIPADQLEILAVTCTLLNVGNVTVTNYDKSVDSSRLIELTNDGYVLRKEL